MAYGICYYTHANAYLAAFSAGITLATVAPQASEAFASVVYGLLAAQSGIPEAQTVFELVAPAIAVSIVAHSMTDVPPRAFDVEPLAGLPESDQPERPNRADTDADADPPTDHRSEGDAKD